MTNKIVDSDTGTMTGEGMSDGSIPGTFSIVARDPDADAIGVAISTALLGVGAVCPHVGPDGAVAVQSFSRATQGQQVISLLDNGHTISDAIATVLEDDQHAGYRQMHGVDSAGNRDSFTGEDCVEWCGSVFGEQHSVAGNMLKHGDVISKMSDAFEDADGCLSERLLTALQTGQAAGGDKRGKISAAILVHSSSPKLYHNLRVDFADDPVQRLAETYSQARQTEATMESSFTELLGEYPDELLQFGVKD